MKQVIQNYNTGALTLEEIPMPINTAFSILVRTRYSAISTGTEKTKIDTARKSLWGKAKARPELVKKIIEKAKKEGFWATYQTVRNRLKEPVTLGYSAVGVVEETGEWVEGFNVGDWVACAGGGYANHAEYNLIPQRLAVKLPNGCPVEEAAFTTIGSIALQGVRQCDPKIGEKMVVIGMGLLGQITAQILKANGCSVLGIDLETWKLDVAKKSGAISAAAMANDPQLEAIVSDWSRGRGADAIILTASTRENGPIEQAGALVRDKGRVVIVGAVGTTFPREPYYMKEVDIRIARSYGPGRYDPLYEELGMDYPIGYVRFTEQRNMEAFVDLLTSRQIDLSHLITHRFSFESSQNAFDLLDGKKISENYLGILLQYPPSGTSSKTVIETKRQTVAETNKKIKIGFIGLGNYATGQLLPRLQKHKEVLLSEVATHTGVSAKMKGNLFGFQKTDTSPEQVILSKENNTLFIVTRHDSHAHYVLEGLKQNKNIFVEKPLCLNRDELRAIGEGFQNSRGKLMVGFNRRFAPLIQEAKHYFPKGVDHILIRVNAGAIPKDHWLNIPEIGGGRLIGEGCHFIDLAQHLAQSLIQSVFAQSLNGKKTTDAHITLTFQNGKVASILYFGGGDSKLPKEYIELHGNGLSLVLDDFKTLHIAGKKPKKWGQQDKGQSEMLRLFLSEVESPIPFEELRNGALATLAIQESLSKGIPVSI